MEKKASLYIVLAALIWSLSGLLVKSVNASILWIVFIRSLGGAIFLLPYIRKAKIEWNQYVLLGGVAMAIFLLAISVTTRLSSAAMAISMQYTAPMYVIGYGFYREKERSRKKILVFALILLGTLCNMQGSNLLSIGSGILTGLSFVAYSYFLQRIHAKNPLGITAAVNMVAAIFCGLLLVVSPKGAPGTSSEIVILALSGLFISGLSYALYRIGLEHVPMERALILCLIEPILNPIWVYFGKGEVPSQLTLFAMLFILSATFLDIVWKEKRSRKKG